ncbi:connector enhancer of kinase suppressor of ras 1 isoform X1 [Anarrhichthys ocellatus]|uniref:connector enhancer of kinase suppressor of ras 1 isoform X1 n=1 Tax=Anarrhichthys ocellatus TaxID=433405 RepID=UPI0012EE13E0|nr:CNK3/IPCEF1 fusion protein-like isoform X1 [Anarrhichthys ocellatus]
MEPITSWSEERVGEWLQGLDGPLHQYPISEWQLSGLDLLQLTSQDLEKLGVQKIGHQELILDAVEKLCSLTYGIGGESLRGLTENLRAVAHTLQMGIQGRWRLNTYDGRSTTKLPAAILQIVVELLTSAKGLFSLLNRYQFSQLSGYTNSKNIFNYCRELGDIVHKDTTVYEKEKDIISVCRQLVSVCDEILNSSPEGLLTHTAQLESVDLVPVLPGDQLGIEITSTGSSNHFVTGTAVEPSSDAYLKILAGDEVIQVNDQIVVGWSRANLVKKLRENPNGVTLVLKKIPGLARRRNPVQLSSTQKEEEEERSQGEEDEENPRHSIFERVAASVRSLSFRRAIQGPEGPQRPMGQEESELSTHREVERLTLTSYQSQQGVLSPLSASGEFESLRSSRLSPSLRQDQSPSPRSPSAFRFDRLGNSKLSPRLRRDRSPSPRSPSPFRFGSLRSHSPQGLDQETAIISSCPEMVGHTGNKDTKKSSTKGMSTAMSRRRVSCRELDQPDCDGWLWKKRKESVFIAQKWQRFWFVLKGPSLYWYTSLQDEKAEGFVNITSYNIESAGEHKRKYVFKMCHQRFHNFFFAADNVSDMSKWINCLITAIHHHKKFNTGPDSEEECYSETESESETPPSTHRRNKKVLSHTLPRPKGRTNMPLSSLVTGGSKGTEGGPVDEMGMMLNNIKEGGVSLIGHEQPITHDHFRKSFIRRNKNPIINEKAHTLRALQSTLKAKEVELLQLNKLLEDSDLSASKYRQWKEQNEELVQEIERLSAVKASEGPDSAAVQDTPTEEVALETVVKETATAKSEGAYRMSLSDGEQLVDAEPSDVLLEIPQGSLSTSPVLELSLGSLQDSINEQLSEMVESGEPAENYFYI